MSHHIINVLQVKLSSCQRIVLLNYNKDTKLIDFRHYSIRLQPVGVSRRIRKFVQNHQVPDLRNLQDVSDFVTKYALSPSLITRTPFFFPQPFWVKGTMVMDYHNEMECYILQHFSVFSHTWRAGYGSESEVDDEAATVSLPVDLGRVNRASNKSAVKLQEVGPRMTLQLIKVEEGLCSGGVIFSEFGKRFIFFNGKISCCI